MLPNSADAVAILAV